MVRAGAGYLSLSQKFAWMETVYSRLRSPRKLANAVTRLQEPSLQRDFAAGVLRAALVEGMSPALFELGVPAGRSALQEMWRRFKNALEASGIEPKDMRQWLLAVACSDDSKWLSEVSEDLYAQLIDLIQSRGELSSEEIAWIRRSMADAVFSLALEISDLSSGGADNDVVISALDFQIACRRASASDGRLQAAGQSCYLALNECRARLEGIESKRSSYELERAYAIINRIELLVTILTSTDSNSIPALVRNLVLTLVDGALTDHAFGAVIKSETSRVSHDLAERMGVVGEKYLVRSPKDYLTTLIRSGGAGLITAGTIVMKFAMASMSSNLFFGGLLMSINYVVSFLLMQVFGFRLATKQPSLTASTLINRLKGVQFHLHKPHKVQKALAGISEDVASIARSQFAAAVGNFGVVIPATILFHFVYRWWKGASFLSDTTALHALESLHPFQTLTIPFAILTGVLLWFSTVLASMVEGWAIELGYVDRSSKDRFGSLFGASSCVFLGLLLAIAPTVGSALGYPIDVRHFTLSTGSLTLSVCSLGFSQAMSHGLLASFLGVLVIGVLNFGVSFVLSLTWGALARGVRRAHLTQVFGMALRYRKFPAHFFLPVEAASVGFSQGR
jgi:site-specific recombinase